MRCTFSGRPGADMSIAHTKSGTGPRPVAGHHDFAEATGERTLAQAVLIQALREAFGQVAHLDRNPARLVIADATRWITDNDTTRPYTFSSICDGLDYNAGRLRRLTLRALRRRAAIGPTTLTVRPVPHIGGYDVRAALFGLA